MILKEKITLFCIRNSLRKKDLAAKIGVTPNTMYYWEVGRKINRKNADLLIEATDGYITEKDLRIE